MSATISRRDERDIERYGWTNMDERRRMVRLSWDFIDCEEGTTNAHKLRSNLCIREVYGDDEVRATVVRIVKNDSVVNAVGMCDNTIQ